jgi:hypothetical protein
LFWLSVCLKCCLVLFFFKDTRKFEFTEAKRRKQNDGCGLGFSVVPLGSSHGKDCLEEVSKVSGLFFRLISLDMLVRRVMPRLPLVQRAALSTRVGPAGQDIFIVGAARTPMGGFRLECFVGIRYIITIMLAYPSLLRY